MKCSTIAALILTFCLSLFSKAAFAYFQNLPSLVIMAEPSLTEAITVISRRYSKNHRVLVSCSFDTSASQIEQIKQGEAVNVFISSDSTYVQQLKTEGVIDAYTIVNLGSNRLALAIPKNHSLRLQLKAKKSIEDILKTLAATNTPFAMTDPVKTDQGHKILQSLEHYALWGELAPLMVPSLNSRQTIHMMLEGNMPGFIYLSDAINYPNLEILKLVDENAHDPIIYQAVVVAGEQMEAGRQFIAAFSDPEYKRILAYYGFKALP